MNTKLYVDDVRMVPDDTWDLAVSYDQAIKLLESNQYLTISLDHDLGDINTDRERTGYDVLMWLTERRMNDMPVPCTVLIHTANPVARDRMVGVLERYWIEE